LQWSTHTYLLVVSSGGRVLPCDKSFNIVNSCDICRTNSCGIAQIFLKCQRLAFRTFVETRGKVKITDIYSREHLIIG